MIFRNYFYTVIGAVMLCCSPPVCTFGKVVFLFGLVLASDPNLEQDLGPEWVARSGFEINPTRSTSHWLFFLHISDLHAGSAERRLDEVDDDDLELNRVVDKTFPALAAEEIFAAFRSGAHHDAVWRCSNGTCYKVHRFVLAMGSPFLRYQYTVDINPVIVGFQGFSAIRVL